MDTRRDSASAAAPVTRRQRASAAAKHEEQLMSGRAARNMAHGAGSRRDTIDMTAAPCWRAEVLGDGRLQAAGKSVADGQELARAGSGRRYCAAV